MNLEIKRKRILELHEQEDLLNKQLSKFDAEIKAIRKKKAKVASRISHTMLYRNKLINEISSWELK